MSASGQKRTLKRLYLMSALPPKAPEDDVTCILEGGGLTKRIGLGAELRWCTDALYWRGPTLLADLLANYLIRGRMRPHGATYSRLKMPDLPH